MFVRLPPAFISAWVTVWLPVHVIDAPTASVVCGQLTEATLSSVTVTPVSGTFPLFETRYV